jgi:hypothetical protein
MLPALRAQLIPCRSLVNWGTDFLHVSKSLWQEVALPEMWCGMMAT